MCEVGVGELYPVGRVAAEYDDTTALWSGDVRLGTASGRAARDERHVKVCGLWLHVFRPRNKERPPVASYHHLDLTTVASSAEDTVTLTYRRPGSGSGGSGSGGGSSGDAQRTAVVKLCGADVVGAVRALRTALKGVHCGDAEMNYVVLCLSPAWLERTEPQGAREATVAALLAQAYRAQCSYRGVCWTPVFADYVDAVTSAEAVSAPASTSKSAQAAATTTKGEQEQDGQEPEGHEEEEEESTEEAPVLDLTGCPGVASYANGHGADGTAVTDPAVAVAALADDRHFRGVVVRGTESAGLVGAAGALLATNRTVTKVVLADVAGTASRALEPWARCWRHGAVQVLSLAGTRLPSGSFAAFARALGAADVPLRVLDLAGCRLAARAVGALLAAVSASATLTASLRTLVLSGNSFSRACWAALAAWLGAHGAALPLRTLGLADTGAPLAALLPVLCGAPRLARLARLDIAHNSFAPGRTGARLDALPRALPALTYLGAADVGFGAATVEPFVAAFGAARTLAERRTRAPVALDLSHNALGADGGAAVARACAALAGVAVLDLTACRIPVAQVLAILDALRDATGLAHLWLGGNVGTGSDRDIEHLGARVAAFAAAHPALRALDIAAAPASAFARPPRTALRALLAPAALAANTTLRTLDISGYRLGDRGAVALAQTLRANSTLTQLAYDRNDITPTGLQCIAHALRANSTLQHIALPHDDYRAQLAAAARSPADFAALAQAHADIARICHNNHAALRTPPVARPTCALDVPAPSPLFAKPTPIPTAGNPQPEPLHFDTPEGEMEDEEEEEDDDDKEEGDEGHGCEQVHHSEEGKEDDDDGAGDEEDRDEGGDDDDAPPPPTPPRLPAAVPSPVAAPPADEAEQQQQAPAQPRKTKTHNTLRLDL